MKGEHEVEMQSTIYEVPQSIMLGSGEELFDHIANCLANFMKEHNVYSERLSLGFTFSFPLLQLGLTKGLLVKWTKGFNCSDVAGEDVVRLLKDAIRRRGVKKYIFISTNQFHDLLFIRMFKLIFAQFSMTQQELLCLVHGKTITVELEQLLAPELMHVMWRKLKI